jgi:AcrR family transcriptional regulator
VNEWGRKDEPDQAIERILDAAEKAFVELGISAAGMNEIASFAGCSRGTLYRYFKNRHELHLAYVSRTSLEIQRRATEAVSHVEDPAERLVEYILRSLREVRDNPATAAWFLPSAKGSVTRMSRSAEVAGTLTQAFAAEPPSVPTDEDAASNHRWIIRVIVSLLSDPGEDEADERMMIERFVVPVVMGSRSS